MKTIHRSLVLFSLILFAALTACSGNQNSVSQPLNAAQNTTANLDGKNPVNASIPAPFSIIEDPDGSIAQQEKRVINGDNFDKNLFERPFTAQQMEYLPDLDILTASIASDESYYYFILQLKGVNQASQTLTGRYGIEFDRTKTGRGDLLVMVSEVTNAWSDANIRIYTDTNADVGGLTPAQPDTAPAGDGYDRELSLEGNKTAYASVLPGIPNALQLAVSKAVLDDAAEFLWGAWADKGVNQPGWFEYNDHFSSAEAGSPLKDNANYPLAALHSLDNTCRQAFGFVPSTYIPATCIEAEPEKENTSFCFPALPDFGCCSFPGDEGTITPTPPDDTPSDQGECVPSIPHISADACIIEASAQVRCENDANIVTIQVPSAGYTASLAGFNCSASGSTLVCTGPKQEMGSPLTIQVCGPAAPIKVPNCKDFPNTFWSEDLGACLTLGSNCCPIGQDWTTDEGKCVPIVSASAACGGAYTLINGVCVLNSSLAPCSTSITVKAPCCFSSCAAGYVLNPNTLCCDRDPCSGVNCAACCNVTGAPVTCPPGCCSCR